jgi:protein-tyrosine phosphatase
MAEVALRDLISQDEVLATRVNVTSAGTANWHIGKEMDERARGALDRAGLSDSGTLGQFASTEYLDTHDVVLVMTREHVRDIEYRLTNPSTQVVLARNLLDGPRDMDVADPYYGTDKDFDACLEQLTECVRQLTLVLRQRVE